jgi:two-component sensor histidine kinase
MPKPGTRVFPGLPALAVEPMSPKAFGLAIVSTVAALGLRFAIGYVGPDTPPFATFFASILLATILAGIGAGVLAAILGLGTAWLAFGTMMPAAFTPAGILLYVVTAVAIGWVSEQYRKLMRGLQEKEGASERHMALVAEENKILAHIAADAPLLEALELLTRSIEDYSNGKMLASVLLLDPDGCHLRHGAAPSLPTAYNQAIDGQEIGPSAGSCGTAAFRKESVYVTNIEDDPLWVDFRDLALPHGLKACWSTPILSRTTTVLGTFALYHHEPRAPSAHEIEIVDLLMRITAVAIEHEQDRQQRQLLVEELTHRVKNTLTVVLSIARSTIRPCANEASYKAFEDRLIALSKTQSLLTQTNWSSVDMHELVTNIALEPFAGDQARFCLDGPPTLIPTRLTLPFALSLHELCTNAAKYGALTTQKGRVLVNWGYTGDGKEARNFFFRWSEADGPPVNPPSHHGFGSGMIKHAFPSDVGGGTTLDFRPEGLVCEILLPVDQLSLSKSEQPL